MTRKLSVVALCLLIFCSVQFVIVNAAVLGTTPAPKLPYLLEPYAVPGWAVHAGEEWAEPAFPEAEPGTPLYFRTLYTSTSCTDEDVDSKMMSASSTGDTVFMDCASTSWNGLVSESVPADFTLMGRGCDAATGGGDLTVVTDTYASGNPVLDITTNTTGKFTICGMKVIAGTTEKDAGVFAFGGQSKSFRMHHMRFDAQTNSIPSSLVQLDNYITGVVDHNILDLHSVGNGVKVHYRNYGGTQDDGSAAFAAVTGFGTSDAVYFEDNIYHGNSRYSTGNDSLNGGKSVFRFNTFDCVSLQTHPSRTGYGRGGRSTEIYYNSFFCDNDNFGGEPHSAAFYHDSGPSLVFGNSAVEGYSTFHDAHSARRSWDANNDHREAQPPDGWGWGGPARQSGTVTVSMDGVTVTKTAGSNFSTSWHAGDMIYIGTTVQDARRIASVSSTTVLTLTDAETPGSGLAYVVGSNWDGNTDVYGYPHLDQPGRGKGDLITGEFPSKQNSTMMCDSSMSCAWPRQLLEPMYDFLNTWSSVPGFGGALFSAQAGVVVQNRDYYLQDDSNCVSGSTCTAGVGVGTTLPTSCPAVSEVGGGVGFWKTNEGSWRTGTPSEGITSFTGQGRLYKCTDDSPLTWDLYYTPYTYPHPLVTNSGGSTPPTQGRGRGRRGRLGR